MSRALKAGIGLAMLFSLLAARPVLAARQVIPDDPAAMFQTNVQKALGTIDQMQALFTRIDQRHQSETAAAAAQAKSDQSR